MSLETTIRQVAKHLAHQKVQAMAQGYCAYRSENESGPINMCAVGCLLKEEDFGPHLRMKDASEIFEARHEINHMLEVIPVAERSIAAFEQLNKLDAVATNLAALVPEFSRADARRIFECIQYFHDHDITTGEGFLHIVSLHKGTDLELENKLYDEMVTRINRYQLRRL